MLELIGIALVGLGWLLVALVWAYGKTPAPCALDRLAHVTPYTGPLYTPHGREIGGSF